MPSIDELLEETFSGQERLSRDEIQRRAVAAGLSAADLEALDALPTGEYAQDEVYDALSVLASDPESEVPQEGIAGVDLDDADLLLELESLHRSRHEALLHAPTQALLRHSERTAELEMEYLRRHPERDIDPGRLRSGSPEQR